VTGPGDERGPGPPPPAKAPPHRGEQPARSTWLNTRERGTVTGIHAAFTLATLLGRRTTRPLIALIALWYRLFDRRAVRSSRAWLQRIHGQPPGFWAVYRHLRMFAQVTLDKVFLVTGRTRALRFSRTGHELLAAQVASGRGAMLVGAHLGSYEAMRAGGAHDGIHIEILGYFANARMINSLLARLDPEQATRVIDLSDDPITTMTRVQGAIEAGHLVAVMADRTGLGSHVVHADFLGARAAFAGGPFVLASLLRCPVYLVFGLYREPNRYELHCERLAERIELQRRDRAAGLTLWVQRYADRLAHYCRLAPDNWFNFFDLWNTSEDADPMALPLPTDAKRERERIR